MTSISSSRLRAEFDPAHRERLTYAAERLCAVWGVAPEVIRVHGVGVASSRVGVSPGEFLARAGLTLADACAAGLR